MPKEDPDIEKKRLAALADKKNKEAYARINAAARANGGLVFEGKGGGKKKTAAKKKPTAKKKPAAKKK